jgi:protein-S-isoprenylcysteine O-methyltransferase Ste14
MSVQIAYVRRIRTNTSRKLLLRVALAILLSVPLVFAAEFYQHFSAYITGNVIEDIITGEWNIAILSILVFLMFLVPLFYRRKVRWVELGVLSGFFVSLFVEMYGIPFSLLFAQRFFFDRTIEHPSSVIQFHLFDVHFMMDLPMVYAALIMIAGTSLVVIGWITLYFGIKDQCLVTTGVYALSRHPQYLGFIGVICGWAIGWPSLLTLVMAPLLVLMYIRVASKEEKELAASTPYSDYRKKTPFLL